LAERTFKELAEHGALAFGDGYRTKRSELDSEGVPILRVAEVKHGYLEPTLIERVSRQLEPRFGAKTSQPGDIVLTTKGTVGRVARVRPTHPRFVYSPQVCWFRSLMPEVVDPGYLYYWLRSDAFRAQADAVMGQTDMAAYINLRDLARMTVMLPPAEVQREVAAVLGALDDKIELNRRIARVLDDLVEAEFISATAGSARAPYGTVLTLRMGSAFKGDHFSEPGRGRPLLRIRDLKTFTSAVWTTEQRSDETIVNPGDVVVGMDAEFRSVLWQGSPSLLNQRVCSFAPLPGVSRAFALHSIRPDLRFFEQAKTGTTVIHLNRADIEGFTVPLLEPAEHAALAVATDPLLDRLLAAVSETHTLEELREALLPKLLSGQLRVREAEELVEVVG
jgi:type I restriction enzyme S subunit